MIYLGQRTRSRRILCPVKKHLMRTTHESINYAHFKTSTCRRGCESTLVKTGQSISVEPGDSVVIDEGVMKVQ
jgi:hypothetical protein